MKENGGPLNNMAACLFAISGKCPAVTTYGYGHMFEEVFYDGKNHVYDLSAQCFFPAMDNESAAFVESARLVAAGKLSTREGAHHCGMSYSTFMEWLHEFESHEKQSR